MDQNRAQQIGQGFKSAMGSNQISNFIMRVKQNLLGNSSQESQPNPETQAKEDALKQFLMYQSKSQE